MFNRTHWAQLDNLWRLQMVTETIKSSPAPKTESTFRKHRSIERKKHIQYFGMQILDACFFFRFYSRGWKMELRFWFCLHFSPNTFPVLSPFTLLWRERVQRVILFLLLLCMIFFWFGLRPIVIFKGYKNRRKYSKIQCSSHLTNIYHPTAFHNNANNNDKPDGTSPLIVLIETISHPIDNISIRFKLRSLCYRWIPQFHLNLFFSSSLSRHD